jgi:hypothetical protein
MGWGIFTRSIHIAYGKLYSNGYDGHVRAYDGKTGTLVWGFFLGSAGYENAYGTYPCYNGFTIADHKVYISVDDHSPDSIPWRGGKMWCINADNGESIWNISGWLRHSSAADGYLTTPNSLDGQIYTFGKGPSQTTVTAAPKTVIKGTSVVIEGKVTDQSPGQKDTPAINDEDMASWMEYVHEQKQIPANAKGVQISITAVDPNGNTQNIGTVTSDISGTFGIQWTPPIEGMYKIIATFAGTNSYGSSYDVTYLGVDPAPSALPTQTPPTPTTTITPTNAPTTTASPSAVPNTSSGVGMEVYIAVAAVAVIAIVAAAALVLRKRK